MVIKVEYWLVILKTLKSDIGWRKRLKFVDIYLGKGSTSDTEKADLWIKAGQNDGLMPHIQQNNGDNDSLDVAGNAISICLCTVALEYWIVCWLVDVFIY